MTRPSSRLAGFYQRPLAERVATLCDLAGGAHLSEASRTWLQRGGGLDLATADRMSENVVATAALPMGLALNLRVNGRDHLVAMAVEEPSVVAAASNAARLVRLGGGFVGDADPPVMTAQIQLDDVPDADAAPARLAAGAARVLAAGDAAIPRMVARGGGCREACARVLDAATGLVVVEVHVDVGDAMGANLVDSVAEAAAPVVQELLGGRIGLRILTNLSRRRRARASCEVPADALGGDALADGIVRASRFAELDAARAATHNKGVMNGIDAAAVALGQDWRAIEAGAHAWAAETGRYRPLATWTRTATGVRGAIELPLAVGTVGGGTRAPGARAALELCAVASARELAVVLASVGLASNLAALKALAGEGIQRGHMRLHRRRLDDGADGADDHADATGHPGGTP
ncbi:MAG: hydroxymethylglutaryl-CoA reductase, degradative [Kofleriaceae bacterium]|nr:hydroxymethylglutaryl-CoA reductase, degradative [Kofleriaceae bacterium]MCB9573665.1 hydroxymethylglutaryl-CoA reductase, degradative [Kofleriaceae bacterium]